MSLRLQLPEFLLLLAALSACRGNAAPLSNDPAVLSAAAQLDQAGAAKVPPAQPVEAKPPQAGNGAASAPASAPANASQLSLTTAELEQIKTALVQAIRASQLPRREELLIHTENAPVSLTERGFRIGTWVGGKAGADAEYKLTYRVLPASSDGFAAYVAHATLTGGAWSIRGPSTQVIHSRR